MKNFVLPLAISLLCMGYTAVSQDSASYYFNRGIHEKKAGRYHQAELNFSKAYKFNQKDIQAVLEWANALMEQRRFTEAKERFVLATVLDQRNLTAVENLANLSYNGRKWQDAIRYTQQLQQLKPGIGYNFTIAKCYYEMEHFGDAIAFCEKAFKEEPRRAEIPYLGARCYMDMHNGRRAAGCYEQALGIDSTNATWMYETALAWYSVPDDHKALYWMERAGAMGYKKTNEYLENLAIAYLNTANYDKGIPLLLDIQKRKPQDPELLYNIGEAYYQVKKFPEAIEYWDKLLELDKNNAQALYMIGMAYQKKGEKQKGVGLCDKAIEMDPSLKNLKQERKLPGSL